ncbi:MAG: DMT family transporter [Sulfuricella denitrificans]|nr:DMT family transporter [Sulfuricella denitrificans]
MAGYPIDVTNNQRNAVIGVSFAVLAAIGFSAKAILVKLAYLDSVDVVTLLALRMVFSIPFFLAVVIWAEFMHRGAALHRHDWLAVVGLGLIGYYLSSLLDFSGLQYISAGLERLILFLYPTMVVVLSSLLYGNPVGRAAQMALVLSYAGIALVAMQDINLGQNGLLLGVGLVFASTLTYSIYLVGAGYTIARIGALRFTAYAMTVACLAVLIQFFMTHPVADLRQSDRVYALSIAMAIFSTVLPVFLLSAGIRMIGSGRASMAGSIGPVSTILLAYIYLGETISPAQIAGSLLVLAGVLIIGLKR